MLDAPAPSLHPRFRPFGPHSAARRVLLKPVHDKILRTPVTCGTFLSLTVFVNLTLLAPEVVVLCELERRAIGSFKVIQGRSIDTKIGRFWYRSKARTVCDFLSVNRAWCPISQCWLFVKLSLWQGVPHLTPLFGVNP